MPGGLPMFALCNSYKRDCHLWKSPEILNYQPQAPSKLRDGLHGHNVNLDRYAKGRCDVGGFIVTEMWATCLPVILQVQHQGSTQADQAYLRRPFVGWASKGIRIWIWQDLSYPNQCVQGHKVIIKSCIMPIRVKLPDLVWVHLNAWYCTCAPTIVWTCCASIANDQKFSCTSTSETI